MPTFSEITITFTNDWVETDNLKISYKTGATVTNQVWTWVATRSSGFEVTTGVATGNPGETSAINFRAAFDLDNPTGYVTTVQNDNEVLIQSETEGEDFVGFNSGVGQTGQYTVAFSNYVTPVTVANIDLALTRSPYYINTPFDFSSTTKVTINLFIWDGDLSNVPSTATTTLTKIRPTVDYEEFNTDISKNIADYLIPAPQYNIAAAAQLIDNNDDGLKWVKFVASYTDSTTSISDIEGTLAAVDGYGYYSEGVNPSQPANLILTSCTYRKVDRTGFILLPFINDGTITSIDVDSNGAQINETLAVTDTTESTDFVQYVCVDVSQASTDSFITITTKPADDVITYEIVDECRYEPLIVTFKNKYGVFENLSMFKKREESLSIKSERFVGGVISSGTYDTTKHQISTINVTGKEKIKMNSGYITESENQLYKELFLSDVIYFYDGGYVPVNLDKNEISFKTRQNDSLVNYSLEFEYAYNTIQNV